MIKTFFFLILLPNLGFSQTLTFGEGKTLKRSELDKFAYKKVEVYNYTTRSYENYKAWPFQVILDAVYGRDHWKDFPFIKVKTKDKYAPIIEVYKFLKRKPYIAFARADQKAFTSIGSYRDKIIELGPYYLIWEENYKKDAARRRDHWPYKVKGFSLEQEPPQKLWPEAGVDIDITWGYKNYLKQCIACHSIDGIGGTNGGELISNGLTKKLSNKYLAQFISNPRKVKPKSKMPPFAQKIDLRKKRIKDIILYLRYMEKRHAEAFRPTKRKTLKKLMDALDQS